MKKQNKNLNIKFLHDCLLLNDILVVGDVHIGYDEKYGKAVYPKLQLEEIIEKFEEIFNYLKERGIKVRKIVQLGDFKHDFGTITDVEWRETLQLLNYFIEKVGEKNIVIIKGNHDNTLKPILKKKNIKLKDYYCVNFKNNEGGIGVRDDKADKINKHISNKISKVINKILPYNKNFNKNKEVKICFLHGDELFKQCLNNSNKKNGCDIFIFGHLHPAITLYDKYKSEKYKCFLKGEWKINMKTRKKLIYILPSFSPISFGYNLRDLKDRLGWWKVEKVKREKEFFVIPKKDLKNFHVIIYNNKEKKEYDFGKFGGLIKE